MQPLSKQEFIDWLKTKKPKEKVGEVFIPTSCPLAYYYIDTNPKINQAWVSISRITLSFSKGRVDELVTLDWQKEFIKEIDSYKGDEPTGHNYYDITAETCLKVLDKIND